MLAVLAIAAVCASALDADKHAKANIMEMELDAAGAAVVVNARPKLVRSEKRSDESMELGSDLVTEESDWEMAMIVDGNSRQWMYDSEMWSGCDPFIQEGFVDQKTKFYCTPAKKMKLKFSDTAAGPAKSPSAPGAEIQYEMGGEDLQEIFNGNMMVSKTSSTAWKNVTNASCYQLNCNAEGFNVQAAGRARCRLGLIMNNEKDCESPDSALGIGCENDNYGADGWLTAGVRVWHKPDFGDLCHQKQIATVWIIPKLGKCSSDPHVCVAPRKRKEHAPKWCAQETCFPDDCCEA